MDNELFASKFSQTCLTTFPHIKMMWLYRLSRSCKILHKKETAGHVLFRQHQSELSKTNTFGTLKVSLVAVIIDDRVSSFLLDRFQLERSDQ